MRKPLAIALALAACLLAFSALAGDEADDGPIHDGVEAVVDLPAEMHVKNKGGKPTPREPDGAGLCVFATLDMCARYQDIRPLIGILERMAGKEEGGGYPEKVDKIVAREAQARGETVDIVQYEGKDPSILDLAMKTGRPCGVTYGFGKPYVDSSGRPLSVIYHMVMLVHLDESRAAIIDNNFPGHLTWMSRAEFLRKWKHPQGKGWAYVLLAPPPPPVPSN